MTTYFDSEEKQAVCDSRDSERIVKFVSKSDFTEGIQQLMYNGSLWGVYYDENNQLVAEDIWGEVHANILAD